MVSKLIQATGAIVAASRSEHLASNSAILVLDVPTGELHRVPVEGLVSTIGVVGGWYTTRSYGQAIENTAAPALDPVIIGEPVALAGTVSCIPFQALGPNADVAPDPTGQRSSGVEVLDELRQGGPNVDLAFDSNGQRSSGHDPICVAG